MRRTSGFSLVECVVAAALCGAGFLALAGSFRAMLQLALLGHRTAGAAVVASGRLASLHGSSCGGAGAGAAASGAYAERWAVAASGASRTASVEVTFALGDHARTVRYESVFGCPP